MNNNNNENNNKDNEDLYKYNPDWIKFYEYDKLILESKSVSDKINKIASGELLNEDDLSIIIDDVLDEISKKFDAVKYILKCDLFDAMFYEGSDINE